MLSEKECANFENFYKIVHEYNPLEGEEIMTVAQQLEEQGIKKGVEQGVEKTAINMLREHLPTDVITKVTGFTQVKIMALAKRFNISLKSQA